MQGTKLLLKLISLGDASTGKSCLIKRYCEGRFVPKYITTIGVDYGVKKVPIGQKTVAVSFFDLSGAQPYEAIRTAFVSDAQVVLLVFDVEKRQTFNNLSEWEALMKRCDVTPKEATIVLLGNKCDTKARQVTQSEAATYAKKKGYQYFSVSASSGENVNQVFDWALKKAVGGMEDRRGNFLA